MPNEDLVTIQFKGKTLQGTKQQLREFMSELPDTEISEEAPVKRESKALRVAKEAAMSPGSMQALKELPQTAAGVVEGATAGLPRMALEKAIPGLEIPRGNLQGQIGGFIAGPGKVLNRVGAALRPAGRVAGPAIQGAVEGGLGGALFPQKGLNPEERLIGAALGSGIGLTIGTGIGVFGAFKDASIARKAIRAIEKQELEFEGTQQAKLPAEIKEEQAFLGTRKAELIAKEKEAYKMELSALEKRLRAEGDLQAQAIKKPTLEALQTTRKELGGAFDEALAEAPNQGLTVGEVRGIANNIADDLVNSGFNADDPAITKLLGFFDESDDAVVISNAELMRMKSAINQGNFGRIQGGRVQTSDVAEIKFASELTKYLKETVPGFERISDAYSKYADLAKFAFKRLNPKGSEFEISKGVGLLKRVADGKLDAGERRAIALLEEKTGISFTKGVKDLQGQIDELGRLSKDKIDDITGTINRRIRELRTTAKLAGQSNQARALAAKKEIMAHRELLDSLQGIIINARRVGVGVGVAGGIALAGSIFGRK